MCLLVILFLLIIPDHSLSQTCNIANLYEEFKEKYNSSSELKKFEENGVWNVYKCLEMYKQSPPFTITETNMEDTAKILRKIVDDLIHQIVDDPKYLTHDNYFPAFRTTCFYSHLSLTNFVKKLIEFVEQSGNKGSAKDIKLTCPLGLIYDIACSFASCLNTGCTVIGEKCDQEEEHECGGIPQISLKPFCKDDFEGFIRSCFFDVDDEKWASALVATLDGTLTNSGCQPLNPIYQGLTSLQVLERSIIAADCSQTSVTLSYFNKEGTHSSSALSWYNYNDDNEVTRDSNGSNWTILLSELSNYGLITCQENGIRVAEIPAKDLCNPVQEDAESPTVTPSTSTGQSTSNLHLLRKTFFRDKKTWLLECNDDNKCTFNGMDAFNNNVRLINNVGLLCVATVSVFGRLTPICGDLNWDAAAAEVFCRDAGLQLGEIWNHTYVGVIQSSESDNQFYKHYVRNLKCEGNEKKLIWCEHDGWYKHDGQCEHDAVVICYNNTKSDPPDPAPPGSGTDRVVIIVVTIVSAVVVIILAIVIWCIFTGNRHRTKLEDLLNINNRTQVVEHLDPSFTTGDTSLRMATSTVDTSRSSNSNHGSFSQSVLNFWSNFTSVQLIVSRPFTIPEDVGEVVKRLNGATIKDWVLLYQFPDNGGTFVCKSFEEDSDETKDNMITEKFFLSNVDHPNVVKCAHEIEPMSVMHKCHDKNEHRMSFFMEYLELGSLDAYLTTRADGAQDCNGHVMSVDDATSIFVGACRALHYVHSRGYVHGDISSDNFLVFINPSTGRLDVKLCDFGSFYKPQGDPPRCSDVPKRTTHLYTAPELLLEAPIDRKGQRVESDPFKNEVWGLGLVLWEVQSWVACKNNSKTRASCDNRTGMASDSVCIISRLAGSDADEYKTCRRHVHVALLEKLNMHNTCEKDRLPSKRVMVDFYKSMYPNNISYPHFETTLDSTFEWPITHILKRCLAVHPDSRPSMGDILRYVIDHRLMSRLSPYIEDIESDLRNIEDTDDQLLRLDHLPTTLQPLGQLYQRDHTHA